MIMILSSSGPALEAVSAPAGFQRKATKSQYWKWGNAGSLKISQNQLESETLLLGPALSLFWFFPFEPLPSCMGFERSECGRRFISLRAVSNTHLTLPTKRIV